MKATGVLNPLDADPSPQGNVKLFADGQGEAMSRLEAAAYEGPRYLSHWATCKNPPPRRKK